MKNIKLGARLAAGFGFILFLALAITALSLWRLESTSTVTQAMMKEPLAKERLIADWYRNVHAGVRRTGAIAKSSDPSLTDFFAQDTAASTSANNEYQKQIEALLSTPEEKEVFESMAKKRKVFIATRDAIIAAKKEGKTEEVERMLQDVFMPNAKLYLDSMQSLLDHQRREIDQMAQSVNEANVTTRILLLVLTGLSLSFGALMAWALTRSIVLPLGRAVSVAQRVARGDLTVERQPIQTDEVGQLLAALEQMQSSLCDVIGGIRRSADSIASASSEIASGNQDLSARTEEAAANLQRTAGAMQHLTGTVNESAQSAHKANEMATSASCVATRGGEVVSRVVNTMEEINAASQKIADIIGVIDGIAFQTNILALNAAVEAARAGEQGRGFAVVAGEVRVLAQRSAQAAREIKDLISSSVERVQGGTQLVADAGATMQEIVVSVKNVSDIIGEIRNSAAEQSSGIGQVGQSVSQLDAVTQQNAALVEQSAAAAESLKLEARRLAEAVSSFRLSTA
ncbi:MAG: methyl-accepting chemotaxis protein [Burkholderiales bacterium]